MDSQIERIKAELSIAAAWRILGLRGRPARECRSPFREDKCASFSVYQEKGWERWWDHGSAQGGDVVDLWARAKGISVKEAVAEILDLSPVSISHAKAPDRTPERVLPRDGIRWPPDIRTLLGDEARALAQLRGLDPSAFDLAGRLGTLKIATVYGAPAWIITDAARICAEARRFDGQMYVKGDGKKLKSFALPGSKKFWPVGLETSRPEINALRNILLVEGGPDYFAAMQLAIDSEINFRPAAMLGAATSIGPQAEKYLRGARVVIVPHNDRSGEGEKAALKWAGQIQALGATDCFIQKLPIVCDDLNDFLIQRPGAGQKLLKDFHDGTSPGRKR